MSEYVKLKSARKIVCSVCKEYAPPGDCPEDCAWMRRLKENAADVATGVHGEWVVCGDGVDVPFMCSHCGKTVAASHKRMYGRYCPNCGARMDGADNG